MANNHQSDFKRNIRREVAGYFIVIMCALPIRFWLLAALETRNDAWNFLAHQALGYVSIGLLGVVFASKLRLRHKLILTFLLVAL